jgi:hypothetical protein
MALNVKDHPENSPEGKAAKAAAVQADTTTAAVQDAEEKFAELGYRGIEGDPTPNENYTVAGVTADLPTPETDKRQAAIARAHQDDLVTRLEGVSSQH